jgi:hypothetical protein
MHLMATGTAESCAVGRWVDITAGEAGVGVGVGVGSAVGVGCGEGDGSVRSVASGVAVTDAVGACVRADDGPGLDTPAAPAPHATSMAATTTRNTILGIAPCLPGTRFGPPG